MIFPPVAIRDPFQQSQWVACRCSSVNVGPRNAVSIEKLQREKEKDTPIGYFTTRAELRLYNQIITAPFMSSEPNRMPTSKR